MRWGMSGMLYANGRAIRPLGFDWTIGPARTVLWCGLAENIALGMQDKVFSFLHHQPGCLFLVADNIGANKQMSF